MQSAHDPIDALAALIVGNRKPVEAAPQTIGGGIVTFADAGGAGAARKVTRARLETVCGLGCDGNGWTSGQDADGYHVAKRCACHRWQARVDAVNAAGIDGRFAPASLDPAEGFDWGWPPAAAHRAALRDWRAGWAPGGRGLLLRGPTGTGKSHIAAGLAFDVLRRADVWRDEVTGGRTVRRWGPPVVRWLTWPDHVADVLAGIGSDEGDSDFPVREARRRVAAAVSRMARVELLVVDELASGRGTGGAWAATLVEEVVGRYVEGGGCLLATTNVTLGQMECAVGDRVMSRVMGSCDVLEFVGDDYRARGTGRAK